MKKKYDFSWKVLHSLHILVFFIPIFSVIGFFRRYACTKQKLWWILAWINAGITILALFVSNAGMPALANPYMTFYAVCYLAAMIYACVTLPSYLNAVIARRESSDSQNAPQAAAAEPPTSQVVFTMSQDEKRNAAAPADTMIQKVHALNLALADQPMYPKLCEIETISRQILSYISQNPGEQNPAHTFTSYYLPEYCKILEDYVELLRTPVKTEKVYKAMYQIQETLPKTCASFENLYNSLYSEKADDISNSINVLEKMMSQDGLTENKANDDSIHLQL